ncbi:MAG: dTDP-4-dehydrorhamnose reductase [Bacteroidales bacterium]|jgi:dTDP-4-dehydrorhamnose reductase
MKHILITGANGQLGSELQDLLKKRKKILFTDIKSSDNVRVLDICNLKDVERFVIEYNIGLIINCAAYTDVDKAEIDKDVCNKINTDGALNLAKAAKKYDASLIQISTDYVFDGKKQRGTYKESQPCHPKSVYGMSKRKAEVAIRRTGCKGIIIRTAWLYSTYGKNFVKKMIQLGLEKTEIGVVADQIGTPTYARDLAKAIIKIIPQIEEKRGEIFHFTNEGKCSWFEFASMIMLYKKIDCRINPLSTAEYPTKAERPQYSLLDKSKIRETFGVETRWWNISLRECLNKLPK